MRRLGRLLTLIILTLAGACAPATATRDGAAPSAASPGEAGPSPSDAIWRDLAEAARKEGKLVLAGSPPPETRSAIPEAFKARFGIDVEYVVSRGNELVNRLQSERAAGLFTVDVVISGVPTFVQGFQDGWFEPLLPLLVVPEVTDLSVWNNNRLPFMDPQEQFMLQIGSAVTGLWTINPSAVNESDLRSLDGLLDPRWRGKIAMEDPTVVGQGQGNAVYLYLVKGEEFFKKLYVDQQPVFSRDDRQISDWLARGTYPITNGLSPEDVNALIRDGLPVKALGPLDGPGWLASGGSTAVVLTNAPHPSAAKLFVNWIASPEGQHIYNMTRVRVPNRRDVQAPWVQPWQVPREGISYVDADDYVHQAERVPRIVARIREILGR